MREFIINANDAAQRTDKFLTKLGVPRALLYKALRKKDIKINGKWVNADYTLCEGDTLRAYLPDDAFCEKTFTITERALESVYEDENIIIINKPVGVPCQSDASHKSGTLVDMLKTYLYNKGSYNPKAEQSFSPALCNRLDVNTAGLVIGAVNAAALREMNEFIRKGLVRKFYLCRVEGAPERDCDTVEGFIEKNSLQNKSTITDSGKYVKTSYRVLERGEISTLEVELHTGRSHQIRAQMAALGCPLCGDVKYGAHSGGGQELCAYKIVFDFESDGVLRDLSHKTFIMP